MLGASSYEWGRDTDQFTSPAILNIATTMKTTTSPTTTPLTPCVPHCPVHHHQCLCHHATSSLPSSNPGCSNYTTDRVAHKLQKFIPHHCGGWKSQVRVPEWLGSGESPPGCGRQTLLRPHMMQEARGLLGSLLWVLIQFKAPPDHLSKGLLPNTVSSGLRISTVKSGGVYKHPDHSNPITSVFIQHHNWSSLPQPPP